MRRSPAAFLMIPVGPGISACSGSVGVGPPPAIVLIMFCACACVLLGMTTTSITRRAALINRKVLLPRSSAKPCAAVESVRKIRRIPAIVRLEFTRNLQS